MVREGSLTVSEAASRLGVSVPTVRKWADSGMLRHWRTPGGQRRFEPGDIYQFVSNGMREAGAMATATQVRLNIVELCTWAAGNDEHIGYDNGPTARPMSYLDITQWEMEHDWGTGWKWEPDCSGFMTWIFKHAGAKDPNGLDYNGEGNTSVEYQYLSKRYTKLVYAHLGAIAIWGAKNGLPLNEQHAAIVTKMGATVDTLEVCSHGSSAGPHIYPLRVENNAHPGAKLTFHDITKLLPSS